jgi:hypothetical protein
MTLTETRDRMGFAILARKPRRAVPARAFARALARFVTGDAVRRTRLPLAVFIFELFLRVLCGRLSNSTYIFALYSIESVIVLFFANREKRITRFVKVD